MYLIVAVRKAGSGEPGPTGGEELQREGFVRVDAGTGVFRTGGGGAVHLCGAAHRRGRALYAAHSAGWGPDAGAEFRAVS